MVVLGFAVGVAQLLHERPFVGAHEYLKALPLLNVIDQWVNVSVCPPRATDESSTEGRGVVPSAREANGRVELDAKE